MSGKQKIYFLLGAIEDARNITPSGSPLVIDPIENLNRQISNKDLSLLFIKLAEDEKVIKLIKAPSRLKSVLDELDPYDHADDGCWHIELLPIFSSFLLEIQQEPDYQKFTGKAPLVPPSTKLSRESLEKIWNVLQEIKTKRGITYEQDDISIPQVHLSKVKNEREASVASDERFNILRKLENEDKAIKDLRWSYDFHQFAYLKIGDNFFDVLNRYEKALKEAANGYEQARVIVDSKETDVVYEVLYTEQSREIIINGFLVKKLRSFSDNDSIFAYLYKNPNQDKTSEDIKAEAGLTEPKDLNKFLENIGFKGELRKVFFKVSKNKIRFNNPITKKHLKELGMDYIKL